MVPLLLWAHIGVKDSTNLVLLKVFLFKSSSRQLGIIRNGDILPWKPTLPKKKPPVSSNIYNVFHMNLYMCKHVENTCKHVENTCKHV